MCLTGFQGGWWTYKVQGLDTKESKIHRYADDTQLFMSASPDDLSSVNSLKIVFHKSVIGRLLTITFGQIVLII